MHEGKAGARDEEDESGDEESEDTPDELPPITSQGYQLWWIQPDRDFFNVLLVKPTGVGIHDIKIQSNALEVKYSASPVPPMILKDLFPVTDSAKVAKRDVDSSNFGLLVSWLTIPSLYPLDPNPINLGSKQIGDFLAISIPFLRGEATKTSFTFEPTAYKTE